MTGKSFPLQARGGKKKKGVEPPCRRRKTTLTALNRPKGEGKI